MQEVQLLQSKIDEADLISSICREDFYFFVQEFWDIIIAEEPVWNWHIKYICDELQKVGLRVAKREKKEFDYYIINVPPGSSKSTIISEMYPLWCWIIDPTQRFICGSYASTPAEDISEKSFNIFNSDKFKWLFPDLVKKASGGKTHFKNGLRGERYTTSTGSGITGIHAHQIIIDDPMSPAIAWSALERERANKWISETLSSRKVNQDISVTIVVMQRLHEIDTTGYLLSKKGLTVNHICIPAELSEDVKPAFLKANYKDGLFDVVRKSKKILATIKADLGSYSYAGQMQQRPSPEDGGILKKHWFEIVSKIIPEGIVINFQLDTAYTDKQANDPTAIISYYVEEGFIYLTNVQSVWLGFPELIKFIPTFCTNNNYSNKSRIRVEPKASGKSIVQQIKYETSLNIIEDTAPKEDKTTRVNSISAKVEAGRIRLHSGSWNNTFIDQCCVFPNGSHDDEIDCLVAIITNELMKPKRAFVAAEY